MTTSFAPSRAGAASSVDLAGVDRVAGGASTPVEASLAHLHGRLAAIEVRVAALVAAQRAHDPDPNDPFRGLYISAAQADALLEVGREHGSPVVQGDASADATATLVDDRADARAAGMALDADAIELAADRAEAAGGTIRLRRLARAFDLLPIDVEILLVALAPDLDPRFERLYGYLNDDVSRRRASVGLALRLCDLPLALGSARARFGADAPLVAGGLVAVEGDRPFLGRALTVPDRVAAHLLGHETPEPAVAAALVADTSLGGGRPAEADDGLDDVAVRSAAQLERALRGGVRLVYLRERIGTGGGDVAREALRLTDRAALVLDLARLAPTDDVARVGASAAREARLLGAGLVAGPIDILAERGTWAVRAFADSRCPVVLLGERSWDPAWAREAPLLMDAPALTARRRDRAWRIGLADAPGATEAIAGIASYPFHIGTEPILRAASSARWSATAEGRPVTAADLAAGVRAQNGAGLERLARRIPPHASWPDLVLPRDLLAQLRDVAARARHRDAVLDGWGLADPSRGRGLTALFTGDSGTGKTLSAEVVAGELGLDLYVIDLSTVVDKYVGETEKNLDRVFSEADGVNGVLLFDEADAIFGKRSEVHDARDRYANVEIAYLLQRMERFDGMAILTTNLRANLDEAFTRRLDVLIDFPMPDEVQRRRLWERHLAPTLPLAGELDLDFLARRFRISGGSVRNIVLAAAYLAAAEGRAVSMADLIRGTEREYRKLGHLSTEAEFGPYFGLLAS
jgi:hypothetical protein